ncbi:MAG TPA: hypothetical protein VIT38_10480 [Allosphingosinicella sp.]|jgi:hypothetical protein
MSAFLLAFLLLAVPGAPTAPGLATPGRAAVLSPLVEDAARCSTHPQLVVAITGFTPPRQGAATLVVSIRTADGRTTRLGEVSVYPHQAFSAPLASAHRFGFAMPRQGLSPNANVVVELAGPGNAEGARALVGEARVTGAPQERCLAINR